MNEYSKKYKKIVNKLVSKSFSRLRGKWIIVVSMNMGIKGYSAAFTHLGFAGLIIVFKRAQSFSEKILKSLLAHELSHYETFLNMNLIQRIKFFPNWLFTKKGKADFETLTDKYAIEKGYGKGLYNMKLITEKKRSKEVLLRIKKHGYLSSKEIKAYAKKIGKW